MKNQADIKFLEWLFVLFISVTTFVLISPESLPDFHSYFQLYNKIGLDEIGFFEPIPYFLMYLNKLLIPGNTSLLIPYFFIFSFFFVISYKLINYKFVNSFGLIVFFSLFTFLFVFILIRASPAYLLVILLVFRFYYKSRVSTVLSIFAILFHITAVIPIILLHLSRIRFLQTRKVYLFFTAISAFSFVFLNFGMNFEFLTQSLDLVGLSKYAVYFDQDSAQKSIFYVYFFFLLVFVFVFIMRFKGPDNITLFFTLILLFVALLSNYNVLAYRFSIYLLAPIILIFPWNLFPTYLTVPFLFLVIFYFFYSFSSYAL